MSTVGGFFFKYRGYLPIPFVLLVLLLADPSVLAVSVGTPLVFLGELLRVRAVAYAGPATRSRSIEVKHLTTGGPYAHLRHPIYLGNLVISLGFLVCFNSWMPYMLVPFILLFSLQYGFIARAEENSLRAQFGAQYHSYAKEVPAFLPRLTPYAGRTTDPPKLKEALRSEAQTMWTVAGVCVLLILRWVVRYRLGA